MFAEQRAGIASWSRWGVMYVNGDGQGQWQSVGLVGQNLNGAAQVLDLNRWLIGVYKVF